MLDMMRNGFQNIVRKRLRSFLTIAGIAIGILAVVLISMIGEIGKYTVRQELSSMGIGGVVVTSDSAQTKGFTQTELEEVKENEAIATAAPLMTQYSAAKMKNTTSDCWIWGLTSDTQKIVTMELLHGRLLNDSDVNAQSRVCMVDESYALENYHRSNIVGKTIELSFNGVYQPFTIVGVTKAGGNLLQSLMGNMVPCFTYVPYTTMQNLLMEEDFTQIVAQVKEKEVDTQALSKTLETRLRTTGNGNVKVEDLNSQMDKLSGIMDIISTVLTVIAGISLVVAGLSIMTVMLVSVGERTKEIGIKKSIGASRKVILFEFLTESFLLSFIGAGIGIGGGVLLGVLGCIALGVQVIIRAEIIVLCLLFALSVGMVFGIYPALKAAALKPVDALRS